MLKAMTHSASLTPQDQASTRRQKKLGTATSRKQSPAWIPLTNGRKEESGTIVNDQTAL